MLCPKRNTNKYHHGQFGKCIVIIHIYVQLQSTCRTGERPRIILNSEPRARSFCDLLKLSGLAFLNTKMVTFFFFFLSYTVWRENVIKGTAKIALPCLILKKFPQNQLFKNCYPKTFFFYFYLIFMYIYVCMYFLIGSTANGRLELITLRSSSTLY